MLRFIALLGAANPTSSPADHRFLVQDTLPARADSLTRTRLGDLEVRVTRAAESRLRVPATVVVVDSAAFRGGQLQNGIDEALGRIPGIYVANRFNPSLDQRLVIRGAGARANFGIRGLKVLLDGIPQTLPDGQTQLTNLDLGTIDRAEVLLGGSSSLYGNAGGGVIAFSSSLPTGSLTLRTRAIGGAFGTSRFSGQAGGSSGLWSGTVGVARYRSDGVRQQSATSTTQLSLGLNRVVDAHWLARLRYYYTASPEARNPGALTLAELAANPDSAAANNILRGADKSVNQHQLGLTVTRADEQGNRFEATVFGLRRDLENPLATAPPGPTGPTVGTFSAIDRWAGGARIGMEHRLDGRGTRLSVGVDLQTMRDDRTNRRSRGGAPSDTIVADQRETVTEVGPYLAIHAEPVSRLTVTGSARYDRVRFAVKDRYLGDGVDQTGNRAMGAASAGAGANFAMARWIALYGTVATSFETPTTTELVNQTNGTVGFNRDLGPQRSVTTELGVRSAGSVVGSLAVYRSAIRDALVQAREQDGRAFFENAGRLTIKGVEAGVQWRVASTLGLQASYSHTDARFANYLVRNGAATDTLTGRQVPGVPRHVFRGIATVTLGRFSTDLDQQVVSRYFADDRNTLAAEGWGAGVMSIRSRFEIPLASGTMLTPFVAVNNLWNRRYVAAVTVNGFGGRVFEPAPGRWAFFGVEVARVR